jgi:hypothetical protein
MLYRSWIIKNPFQWEAWIIQRRFVPEGTPVGYNQRAHTVRPSILGVIPIGYSDGYPRSLSMQEMYALVGETPCPIIGIISMNLTIIDITDASPHETCATLDLSEGRNLFPSLSRGSRSPYSPLKKQAKRFSLSKWFPVISCKLLY